VNRDKLKADFEAAQTLQAAGRLAEAERLWLDLDAAMPGHVGLLTNLASVQLQLGRPDAAEASAGRALERQPDLLPALQIHAAAAEAQGAVAEAAQRFERVLALQPDAIPVLTAVARLHRRHEDWAQARRHAERLAALTPDRAAHHDLLGAISLAMNDLAAAEAAFGRALAIDPALASARANLGAVFAERRQWGRALEHLDAALASDASAAEAHNNRGNALAGLARAEEAEAAFARALELDPGFADAAFNLALVRLRQGHWAESWPGFERRWETRQMAPFRRDLGVPRWDGSEAPGLTLLIHAEQGMGDMMMMARYFAMASARVGRLVVECQPELAPLLAAMQGGFDIVAAGDALPAFDLELPAMSLPAVFGTEPGNVPWSGPYLRVPESGASLDGAGRKVGLVWAGNPRNPTDAERSLDASLLAPLLAVPGCTFFSLQWGAPGDRLQAAGLAGGVHDLRPRLTDFAATAALVAELDLVISICTSVAHLAGGMGKPLWLMLASGADWRWLESGDATPWYPAARLFRQQTPGDWGGVVEQIAAALKAEAGE
jgi:tetratricopeptide (TPR) repeat protein